MVFILRQNLILLIRLVYHEVGCKKQKQKTTTTFFKYKCNKDTNIKESWGVLWYLGMSSGNQTDPFSHRVTRYINFFKQHFDTCCCIRYPAMLGSTPTCHRTRGEFATPVWTQDTPRPSYGQKTPKKLVRFNVSFRIGRLSRIVVVSTSSFFLLC